MPGRPDVRAARARLTLNNVTVKPKRLWTPVEGLWIDTKQPQLLRLRHACVRANWRLWRFPFFEFACVGACGGFLRSDCVRVR